MRLFDRNSYFCAMRRNHLILSLLYSVSCGVFLNSCKTESSFVPSFIRIDSVSIDALGINGNSTHDIQAVQVYVNNQTMGTFPIPSEFPVNGDGNTVIQISPFVKINGNSQTLVPFRSLDVLTDTLTLQSEKTVSWNPTFKFRDNAKIIWQEDFEDSSSTLVPISRDSFDYFNIEKRPFDLNGRFNQNSLVYVSRFNDVDSFRSMDLAYFQRIPSLPSDGRDIILEFDIKTDLPVLIALRRFGSSQIEYVPYVTVNPTKNEWKRFYINLLYETQGQKAGTQYEIFFSCDKGTGFSGSLEFLIDNIRLSYLD